MVVYLQENIVEWDNMSNDSKNLILDDWEGMKDVDDATPVEPPEPEPPEPPEPEGGGFWNGVRDSISRVGESIRNLFRRD